MTRWIVVVFAGLAILSCSEGVGPAGLDGQTGPAGPVGPMGPEGPAGADGEVGATGASGESVVSAALEAGDSDCPNGGARLSVGGVDTFVCNGTPGVDGVAGAAGPAGADGADGESVAGTTVNPGDATCPYGGVKLSVGGVDTYACNGAPGPEGAPGPAGPEGIEGPAGQVGPAGADGESVASAALEVGDPDCPNGGARFTVDGVETFACNGTPGVDGAAGAIGPTGATGATGAIGPVGPTGAEGPVGPIGPRGLTGLTGETGAAGISVTGESVAPGDAHCPYGGSRFTSASGTTYACSAPGSVPSIDPASLRVLVDFGVGAPALFAEVEGLGTANEVIEQRIVDASGQEIIRKVPGALTWGDVILRRGIDSDLDLWAWRAQVEQGAIATARRTVSVSLLDPLGAVVTSWTLADAWPVALTVPAAPGPFSPYVIEELVIVAGPETRDVGGSQNPGQPPAGFTFQLGLAQGQIGGFVAASGIGSASEVVEHRIVGPTGEIIEKIPGRLSWGDVKLRCTTECGELLHTWRSQVVAGQVAQARQDVSLRLFDAAGAVVARWNFASAWPSQSRIVPAATGGTFEEVTLVHEGVQRVR